MNRRKQSVKAMSLGEPDDHYLWSSIVGHLEDIIYQGFTQNKNKILQGEHCKDSSGTCPVWTLEEWRQMNWKPWKIWNYGEIKELT